MVNNAHRLELERGSPMACPDDRQDSLSTSTVPCTPVHNPLHPCTPTPPHCVPLVTRIQRDCALPQCRGNLASVLPGPISPIYFPHNHRQRYLLSHMHTRTVHSHCSLPHHLNLSKVLDMAHVPKLLTPRPPWTTMNYSRAFQTQATKCFGCC